MIDRDLARPASAEAVGTALLVAIVVGSGIAAQRLSPGDVGLQLLENSTATGAGLVALILALGPVSGAHFNPVVTLADRVLGGISTRDAGVLRRRAGGRRVRRRDGRQPHVRAAGGHVLDAHAIGRRALARRVRRDVRPAARDPRRRARRPVVGRRRTRSAATSPPPTGSRRRRASRTRRSRSRARFTNTFAGISPSSVPMFIVIQVVGAVVAVALVRLPLPRASAAVDRRDRRAAPRVRRAPSGDRIDGAESRRESRRCSTHIAGWNLHGVSTASSRSRRSSATSGVVRRARVTAA